MAERRSPALAFAADVRTAMVRNLRLAGVVGTGIVPVFGFLDHVNVPDQADLFLTWRLAASGVLAAIVALTWTERGRAWVTPLGYAALLAAALPVSAMVARLDPGVSPYYAGLDLAMLFNGLLFPWHPAHTAAVNLILLMSFLLPVGAAGGPSDAAAFTNNTFFILATGMVSTLSSWALFREHWRRFELSWSLESRSRDLAAANERLRSVDEAKTRFFANVSHELRTPVTLALTPVEAALRDPTLPESARGMLDSLSVDLRVLSRRIDDLVELARLDSGGLRVKFEPVDLGRVVREVLIAAGPFAEREQIRLVQDVPGELPAARGDARMVEEITFNLVSNALKFTPPEGEVEVTLRAEPNALRLRVRDTGPGIDLNEQPNLFVRFGRSTDAATARGAGLGLALVKEFAELQGGRVEVTSAPGQGTRFDVWLPIASAADVPRSLPRTGHIAHAFVAELSEREDAAPALPPVDDRPLVLVVDDNPRLRKMVGHVLGRDLRIAEARDGEEALRLMELEEPCVVVTDLMMPRLDGVGLVRRVRARAEWATLPVLLLTAWSDGEVRDDALELGATDFLGKPFEPRELRARVRNFVALRLSQRRLAQLNEALTGALATSNAAQLRAARAEKLASIGQLAAGIGHEVKNPVNYILNFARPGRAQVEALEQTADGELADELHEVSEVFDRIIDGAERIEGIVNGLQAFARGGEARVPVRFDREIDAAVRMVRPAVPAAVKLHLSLDCEGTVLGSPVAVGAVVVNLVSNALRAVNDGGNVWVRAHGDDTYVSLEIEDDGVGIPAEHLTRIWDPFFTTRRAGEGLGLGLSLVHRIVNEDLGGTIEVESTPGVGTRFVVTLPRGGAVARSGPWSDIAGAS